MHIAYVAHDVHLCAHTDTDPRGLLWVPCSLHRQDPWHPEHYGSYTPECLGLLFSVVKGNQKCNLSTPLVCPPVALFCTSFWILLDRFGVCAVVISQSVKPVQWFPPFSVHLKQNKHVCVSWLFVWG